MMLAHSARPRDGIPCQTYTDHVQSVSGAAGASAAAAAAFHGDAPDDFVRTVRLGAVLHDLGKLDPDIQASLASSSRKRLPINHVDAGVAELLRLGYVEAALLVFAHHGGLPSLPREASRGTDGLRDVDVASWVNGRLNQYRALHRQAVGNIPDGGSEAGKWSGLKRRLGLSCLVDADHGDTARHYRRETEPPSVVAPRWSERLALLDAYVARLGSGSRSPRDRLRSAIYEACRHADTGRALRACDSPVGSGKTTAVMAHLLRTAINRNLRHVLVVLPYTNIITQSVRTYRQALVLAGEQPGRVVAEHHHRADFEALQDRHLASLWASPITVTTAVQFFETLASASTSRLRKLHQIPGSAVFFDEAHAAIPAWLWPQAWRWLKELADAWGCHFVFGSGSLVRLWEMKAFADPPDEAPDLVPPDVRHRAVAAERRRVVYRSRSEAFDRRGLANTVLSAAGPRLVIMNTVRSAAVIARDLRKSGREVEHLSTALTPADRDRILERIRERLRHRARSDWTLVATSCVEAGMEFSFRTAFRESAGACSLVQVGGRVNRHAERPEGEVWDFRASDAALTTNPGLSVSASVLDRLWREGWFDGFKSSTDVATEALRREVMSEEGHDRAEAIMRSERCADYPEVGRLFRVIDTDSRLVIVDADVRRDMEADRTVETTRLLRGSVQMGGSRVERLGVPGIHGHEDLYEWPWAYDPDFLGYMEEILRRTDGSGDVYII